jgi:hypothetical protein
MKAIGIGNQSWGLRKNSGKNSENSGTLLKNSIKIIT